MESAGGAQSASHRTMHGEKLRESRITPGLKLSVGVNSIAMPVKCEGTWNQSVMLQPTARRVHNRGDITLNSSRAPRNDPYSNAESRAAASLLQLFGGQYEPAEPPAPILAARFISVRKLTPRGVIATLARKAARSVFRPQAGSDHGQADQCTLADLALKNHRNARPAVCWETWCGGHGVSKPPRTLR